jgi:hypothetical protein
MKRLPKVSELYSPDFLFRGEDFQQFMLMMLKGALSKKARDEVGEAAAKFVAMYGKLHGLGIADITAQADRNAVALLRKDGFALVGDVFPPSDVDAIYKYIEDKPIRYFNNGYDSAEGESFGRFHELPGNTRFGYYSETDICRCPAIYRAIHNPHLLDTMAAYLETLPTISTVSLWWSFPSDVSTGGMQFYHHDRGDFRSCNLFVYLSDVQKTGGPHAFVKKTHNYDVLAQWAQGHFGDDAKALKDFWVWMESHRKADEQIRNIFSENEIKVITGPKGRSFFEDTRGLHKGTPPESESRLCFEIVYSTLPKYNELHDRIGRAQIIGLTQEEREGASLSPHMRYATRLMYE